MANFKDSLETVEDLLKKAKKVSKGESLEEAEIEVDWMTTYATIVRRCRDEKEFGLSRYPYEQGPSVNAFGGGFFEHKEWPLGKGLEKHSSLRPIAEYEANYVNAAGYWMSFHHTAIKLRQEALAAGDADASKAVKYDAWAIISVRYGLRAVGLRVEFYKRAARDPTNAKLVMPALEQRYDMAPADDLDEAVTKLETHMTTQLMKAVASLSATNAVKRTGKDGAAKKQ